MTTVKPVEKKKINLFYREIGLFILHTHTHTHTHTHIYIYIYIFWQWCIYCRIFNRSCSVSLFPLMNTLLSQQSCCRQNIYKIMLLILLHLFALHKNETNLFFHLLWSKAKQIKEKHLVSEQISQHLICCN